LDTVHTRIAGKRARFRLSVILQHFPSLFVEIIVRRHHFYGEIKILKNEKKEEKNGRV